LANQHEAPPTGQGLRIRITIESTGPPIEYTTTGFISYSSTFKESDLTRRVFNALTEKFAEVNEVFEHQFSNVVKKVYYPNQVKGE
jgi:hypothetical protein